jgi:membrane protease YdiL (CAAX protease family)
MSSPESGSNGGPSRNSDSFDMNLEPVNPAELNIQDAPTVEAADIAQSRSAFAPALFWFVLFIGLCTVIFLAALAIANGNFSPIEKAWRALALAAGSAMVILSLAVYSACQKGFTFGKAFLWCLLFVAVTQGIPAVLLTVYMIAAMMGGQKIDVQKADWMSAPEVQALMQGVFLVGQTITVCFSLFVLRQVVGKDWKRKIAFRLPTLEHVVLVLLAMPALLVVSGAFEEIVVRYIPSLSRLGMTGVDEVIKSTKSWPWWIAVLAIGIGPAIGEELWCRGFLGQGLSSRYGNWGGVLLASFLFGLIHIEPPQAVMAFLMGIVLHLSYLATRSILIPMMIHFLNNTLIILSISETGSIPLLETLEIAYLHSPWLMLSASLLVLIAVGLILHRTRVRVWSPSGREAPQSQYPHVQTPVAASANKAIADGIPVVEIGAMIVAVGLFAAIWFGL